MKNHIFRLISISFICFVCLFVFVACDKSEHTCSYSIVITNPTCTEQGYTTHTCPCGDSFKDTYRDVLNHEFTNYISDGNATQNEDGTKTATCNRTGCNATDTITDVGSKLVHTHNISANTCQTCGKTLSELAVSSYDISNNLDGSVKGYVIPLNDGDYSFYVVGQGDIKNYTYSNTPLKADGYSSNIKQLYISNNITSIGDYLLYSCQIESVVLPQGLVRIGDNAFAITNLQTIIIPNTVKTIEDYAFNSCSKLDYIEFQQNSNLENIGHYVFSNTKFYNNESNWKNKILYIDEYLISSKTTLSGSLSVKEGTKIIASYAFYDCSSLTSIYIPDSVISIGSNAFYGCNSIKKIDLPFSGANLEGDIDTSFGYIFGGSYKCPSSIEEISIRGGKDMAHESLRYVTNLKSLSLPFITTKICKYFVFWGESSKSIPDSLTTITIHSGEIPDYAFEGCDRVLEITLGNDIEKIGYRALMDCSSLQNITLPFVGESDTCVEKCDGVLGYIFGCAICSYHLDECAYDEGGWTCQIYDGYNSRMYHYNIPQTLKKVVITNDLTIPENAFYNCKNLLEIKIPFNAEIGNNAFKYCPAIIYYE